MQTLPERYLMIGDEGDVPAIHAMLQSFPARAAGNIVLELPSARCPALPLPRAMGLSVLPRGTARHGIRAVAALESWVAEWVAGDHEPGHMHAIWVGMPGDHLVDRLCAELLATHRTLHLHRPSTGDCRGADQEIMDDADGTGTTWTSTPLRRNRSS